MREIKNYMINIKILKTLKEDTKRKAFIERNKAEHILKKGNTLETRRHIPIPVLQTYSDRHSE